MYTSQRINEYFNCNCRHKLTAAYAPVICIPGSLGAGDSGDIAGPKCRDLTFDESRQCRRCAGVLISRQNANLCHILTTRGSLACTFAQSDQLLFRCLDEHSSWYRKYCC